MEINAFHVNISKAVTNFHFLPPVYNFSIARQKLILPIVHTKSLSNADNLITVSFLPTVKQFVTKIYD
jgi:hypothetical protein